MRPLIISLLLAVGCTDSNPIAEMTGGSSDDAGDEDGDDGDDDASADAEPLEAGKTSKVKEKTLILPGKTTGPPPPVEGIKRKQCKDLTDGGPVVDGECYTAELGCDSTVVGHTRGGVDLFSTRFYEKHFCTPATTNHDGGDERVYYIRAPEGPHRIWVTLDTPCADLDLSVISFSGGGDCPSIDSNVMDCEMWPKPGNKREVVHVPSTGGGDFLAVVEGKDDEEGAFALTVQCHPGL